MARYFFQAQYHGATLTDDLGENFGTLQEAEAHARGVANELGRNSSEASVCPRRRWKGVGAQRRFNQLTAGSRQPSGSLGRGEQSAAVSLDRCITFASAFP